MNAIARRGGARGRCQSPPGAYQQIIHRGRTKSGKRPAHRRRAQPEPARRPGHTALRKQRIQRDEQI